MDALMIDRCEGYEYHYDTVTQVNVNVSLDTRFVRECFARLQKLTVLAALPYSTTITIQTNHPMNFFPAAVFLMLFCSLAAMMSFKQVLTIWMNTTAPTSTEKKNCSCATDHNITKGDETKESVPVFYNVFVAQESDAPRVRSIVMEQFTYLRPEHHVHLHSIGFPIDIANTTLLQYHEQGDEVETLHSLWEYCSIQPESKVVYLHSKGSFTPSSDNDILRRFLTAGALSQECLDLPQSCNVCSSRMSPLPHPHTPGNMWLIDPKLFDVTIKTAAGTSFKMNSPCHGHGRFSAEHWVHSHPLNMPCDLYSDPVYVWNYKHLPAPDFSKELAAAPRFPFDSYKIANKCLNIGVSMNERISEYAQLYNASPPSSWWGWSFYPTELTNSTTEGEP
jgi:hypothetical protein